MTRKIPPRFHPAESYSHLVKTSSIREGRQARQKAVKCQPRSKLHRRAQLSATKGASLSQSNVAQKELCGAWARRATRKVSRWTSRCSDNLNCLLGRMNYRSTTTKHCLLSKLIEIMMWVGNLVKNVRTRLRSRQDLQRRNVSKITLPPREGPQI